MKRMIMTLIMAAVLAVFPLVAQADDGGSQSGGNNGGSQGNGNNGSQQSGGNNGGSQGNGNNGGSQGNGTHEQKGFGNKVGGFVDEDGDGFNDLAPDEDGDGIPNGLDPDFQTPKDGTGNQFGKGRATDEKSLTDEKTLTGYRAWFSYLLAPMTSLPGAMEGFGPHGETKSAQGSFGQGPGGGTGLGGDSPGGGTGFGPGGTTGDCDGSGPNRPDSNDNSGRNQQGGRL